MLSYRPASYYDQLPLCAAVEALRIQARRPQQRHTYPMELKVHGPVHSRRFRKGLIGLILGLAPPQFSVSPLQFCLAPISGLEKPRFLRKKVLRFLKVFRGFFKILKSFF